MFRTNIDDTTLDIVRMQRNGYQQELNELSEQNQILKNQIEHLQAYESPLKDLQDKNNLLREEKSRLHQIIRELNACQERSGQEILTLKDACKCLESEKLQLSEAFFKAYDDYIFLESRNAELQKKIADLEDRITLVRLAQDSSDEEILRLQCYNDDLVDAVDELRERKRKEPELMSTGDRQICQLKTNTRVGCKESLPLDFFYKGSNLCKECSKKRRKRRRR
jgi:chromosome segregation ATPase